MSPLFQILQGDPFPASPRQLTTEAKDTLTKVEVAIKAAQLTRVNTQEPLYLLTFRTVHTPTGAIWQPSGVIEWLHLAHIPQKLMTPFHDFIAQLVIKGRTWILQIIGTEPNIIVTPFSMQQHTSGKPQILGK